MGSIPESLRQKVYDKKGEECLICGTGDKERFRTNYIHLHHVNGDETDNRLENLIPVCNECHINIHRNLEGKYKRWHEKLPEESRYTSEDHKELINKRNKRRGVDTDYILVAAGNKARKVIPPELEHRDALRFEDESALEEQLAEWHRNKRYKLYYTKSQRKNTDISYSIGVSFSG